MARALLIEFDEVAMKTTTLKLGGWLVTLLLVGLWPRTAPAYDEIAVKDGATIRGVVRIDGKAAKLAPLQITKYKEFCKDGCIENGITLYLFYIK